MNKRKDMFKVEIYIHHKLELKVLRTVIFIKKKKKEYLNYIIYMKIYQLFVWFLRKY